MPPKLSTSRRTLHVEITKLQFALQGIKTLPVELQYLLAEILLIRGTAIFEHAIAETAYKVAAGATYLDGSIPNLLHPCKSMDAARTAMMTVGRQKATRGLKWTRARFIKDSTQYVISPNDHIIQHYDRFGSAISEIFQVRNFAAHRNTTSRNEFKQAVRKVYGRHSPMQLGTYLLSPNYVATPNLQRYFIEMKAIIDDAVKYFP